MRFRAENIPFAHITDLKTDAMNFKVVRQVVKALFQ